MVEEFDPRWVDFCLQWHDPHPKIIAIVLLTVEAHTYDHAKNLSSQVNSSPLTRSKKAAFVHMRCTKKNQHLSQIDFSQRGLARQSAEV